MIQQLLRLVSEDKLEEAVKDIEKIFVRTPKLFELVQQRGRLTHLKNSTNLGIIKDEDYRLERNKIRWTIISLIQEIDEVSSTESPVSKEKININQSHFGTGHNIGRDLIMGDKH